ncbi:MAG: type II toxin-antitoxin system PemK/MazF family toxin [Pseudomonadota bacterium]
MPNVKRFQVWLVQLNPTQGKEINKTRPCIVISPDEMAALSTVLVAPMTTKGFDLPCRVKCIFDEKNGLILLDQIRAVDKQRLIKKLGVIDESIQIELCSRLQELFAY